MPRLGVPEKKPFFFCNVRSQSCAHCSENKLTPNEVRAQHSLAVTWVFFPKASWRFALVWDWHDCGTVLWVWEMMQNLEAACGRLKLPCNCHILEYNLEAIFFFSWTTLYFTKSLALFHFKTYLIRRHLQYYLPSSCLLPLPMLWYLGCLPDTNCSSTFLSVQYLPRRNTQSENQALRMVQRKDLSWVHTMNVWIAAT